MAGIAKVDAYREDNGDAMVCITHRLNGVRFYRSPSAASWGRLFRLTLKHGIRVRPWMIGLGWSFYWPPDST